MARSIERNLANLNVGNKHRQDLKARLSLVLGALRTKDILKARSIRVFRNVEEELNSLSLLRTQETQNATPKRACEHEGRPVENQNNKEQGSSSPYILEMED